ncbi:MAG: DUF4124 domain-containing protein [Betaproteobacteria bacterium]|nr:MAG: DUF4124 domain-containing protein [Betaproteobacteria bacterium]
MKASKGWAHLIGLGVLLLAASATTMAQTTYRWDDVDGQTHYSDTPPPAGATNVKVIKDRGFDSYDSYDFEEGAPSASTPSYVEQEARFQERQAKKAEQQAEAEKERLAAAERKKNCDLARSNYNTVSVGGRITRINEAGEREYMSDEEIERATAEARRTMEQWCDN